MKPNSETSKTWCNRDEHHPAGGLCWNFPRMSNFQFMRQPLQHRSTLNGEHVKMV